MLWNNGRFCYYLATSSFAKEVLPLRMQWWRGVWPFASRALILAPYCKRSSIMPTSAVRHARWSSEHPSKHSSISFWSSFRLSELIELVAEASWNESPVPSNTEPGCRSKRMAFASVELLNAACLCKALISTSESTMRRYTTFLLLPRTASQICWAVEICWSAVGLLTKSFSTY